VCVSAHRRRRRSCRTLSTAQSQLFFSYHPHPHTHPTPQPPSLHASEWEKTFKVCKCEGLGGPGTPPPAHCQQRARDYGQELSDLLFTQSMLCTGDWPCFEAYDDLADGTRQNLTHRVQVVAEALKELELPASADEEQQRQRQRQRGARVRGGTAMRRFVLPIEVADNAGNKATAALRFNVEEISLWDVIQPDKPPVRSPTMPRAPPPPLSRRPPPAPVQQEEEEDNEEDEEEEEEVVAVTVEQPAAAAVVGGGEAENETRPASCKSTASRASSSSTSSGSSGTSSRPVEAFDEEQGVAQLLFMLVVALLVALCIWGTRGTAPEEMAVVGGDDRDDPVLDGSDSSSFVYSESPNPTRSRLSATPTPATPMRSSPGAASFYSPRT
jgi:hypothetical protein